ncbi:hypothetical protein [Paraflavitalea speifideaquila]|uniref:hypothetical protein n=1 Tax=Paraflavitalea speifideaquila TaxID=3076558 RepID=UPI0028E29ED7|nr:hypothetical protein [Paraflavitalea speifideiaquila]
MNQALSSKFALLLCMVLCFQMGTAQTNTLYQQTSEVNNLMVQYDADRGSLSRFYALESSPDRRQRLQQLQNDYLKQLQQLKFESLSTGSKVDYLLFKRNMEAQLDLLKEEEQEYNNVSKWFGFADQIYEVERIRRRGTQQDAQKLAATMNALALQINTTARQLDKETGIDISLSRRAGGIVRGLQAALRSVNEFYTGYDPAYTWWTPEPLKKLESALSDYARSWQQKKNPPRPVKMMAAVSSDSPSDKKNWYASCKPK